jgi:D-threo-aldose 1-dehydrogenase
MKRGRLGRTEVRVTELGFGGAPIGNLYAPAPPELLADARRYAELARAHGATLPQLALRHPAVASVVAGMATPEQSSADAAWLAEPVPEILWDLVAP